MMRLSLFPTALLFFGFQGQVLAQQRNLQYLSLAITNSASSFPVSGVPQLWKARMHPGFTVGSGFNWKQSGSMKWAQTFKLGYFFHRYIQHAVMLYTESGIRYTPGKWGFSAMLGAGYLHSIPATGRFKQQADGSYSSFGKAGRPQAMLGFTLGIDYAVGKGYRFFSRGQTLLQTPFIPGYVPLLPINQVHLGFSIPIHCVKKS
jgi:hypothetical protein